MVTEVITFDHHYILEKVEEGTKVIQKEEYTGFYVNFWDSSWVEPAYNQVNEALKKEVEEENKITYAFKYPTSNENLCEQPLLLYL